MKRKEQKIETELKNKLTGFEKEAKKLHILDIIKYLKDYTTDSYKSQFTMNKIQTELQQLKSKEIEMLRSNKNKDYDTKKKELEEENKKLFNSIKDQEPKYLAYYKTLEERTGFKVDIRNAWSILELILFIINNKLTEFPEKDTKKQIKTA